MQTRESAEQARSDTVPRPERSRFNSGRFAAERFSLKVLATAGIVGIAVALGAILVASDVDGWLTGLIVGAASLALDALMRSSQVSERFSREATRHNPKGQSI